MASKNESEILESKVAKALYKPVSYKINLHKISDTLWRLSYSEKFTIKNPNERQKMLHNTITLTKMLIKKADISVKGQTITMVIEDSFEKIANIIVGEFIGISTIGNLCIRDLILLAGANLIGEKALSEAGLIKERKIKK